nr:MAG TPA: hypothetical protein [Caudoviricetes sp.]
MLQFSSLRLTPSSPIFTILTIKKLKILIVSSLFFLFNLKVKYFLKRTQKSLFSLAITRKINIFIL